MCHFSQTKLHTALNACCSEYVDTRSSKVVDWPPENESPHRCTIDYWSEVTVQRETAVASVNLPIINIYSWVPPETNTQWWPATIHNPSWMDHDLVIMEDSMPFCYCTLWMFEWHTVTLYHDITVYNEMFNRMDGVMWALVRAKTQRKRDLYMAEKFARKMRSKKYAEVIAMLCLVLIPVHILNHFRMFWSFRKLGMWSDINPEDETSYTPQYPEVFLGYVENECCAKLSRLPIIEPESVLSNNPIPSAMDSGSGSSSWDSYDLRSQDEEYLMPTNVAEMTTSGWSDHAARLWTAARLYLNPLPESPKNWGQGNANLNDYHSNPMEISRTFWIPDIKNWGQQEEQMHSKNADVCNVAWDIFSIIPHGVGVEASCSQGWDDTA